MLPNRTHSRREFLWRAGGGFGALALTQMLGANSETRRIGAHSAPKAKRVIQLFMNGGVSQMDTFDYKPLLEKMHDQKFDPGSAVEAATSVPGKLMRSPFEFKQHGECGRWVSSAFPHVARCVDDLAFLMAMSSKTNVHGPGSYMMNTGFLLPGFPCLGAWLSYGLGSLSDNLPTFVVLPDVKGLPYNQKGNFSAGFLPVQHQGTIINAASPQPIYDLAAPENSYISAKSEKESFRLLQKLNRSHAERWQGDALLDARIASYELAARLQLSAARGARFENGNRSDAKTLRSG